MTIGCSIIREYSIVAIWKLLHCRVGTNKLMSFVVKILSNDALCIAYIIGQVLLEPSTLFTPVCYSLAPYNFFYP